MAEYMINKGVGKQVEFKGLRAQYVFIFAGGLLGVFVLFVVLYMMGAPPVAVSYTHLIIFSRKMLFSKRQSVTILSVKDRFPCLSPALKPCVRKRSKPAIIF